MEEMNKQQEQNKEKKDRWWFLPLVVMGLALVVNLFILVNVYVPSGSMEPTLSTGALLIGDRNAYRVKEPETGDVILFRHAELGEKWLVKRVIALPGQTFSMRDGRVYLDGQLLEEDYIAEFSTDSCQEIVVPEDCYLVLGDNRINSNDSRYWNDPFVHREDLLGRALFTYFPQPHLL